MKSDNNYTEIAEGVYWLGFGNFESGLQCNAYLLVDENDEAVLIDPGNVLDFENVYKNVLQITALKKISYIILHHQDPDLVSSVTLFEKKGIKAKIVTHWRTAVLIKYYGIKSEYYLINENNFELKLSSGRTLQFLPTPYLHFPGAIVTYDPINKLLFSSDLFGAISQNWKLFADESYMEAMKMFHENYMPSNDIIRPVMESFLKYDINMIAPQHGSIINTNIRKYITTLRDLECGTFLNPIKRDLVKTGGYTGICNQILKRYYGIFGSEKVIPLFSDSDILLNQESGLIIDFNMTGVELWNKLFEILYTKKGLGWIIFSESLVHRLVKEYNIDYPEVFHAVIFDYEKKSIKLEKEAQELINLNIRLEENLASAQENLIKCPITGLYNEIFFKNYLKTELSISLTNEENCTLMLISLDNASKLRFKHGEVAGQEIIKNLAMVLNNQRESSHALFKLDGSQFAYYIPKIDSAAALKVADGIRHLIETSEAFIQKITVSIGLVNINEFFTTDDTQEKILSMIINVADMRVGIAKNRGMNAICYESPLDEYQDTAGKILIIDTDKLNVDVLTTFLKEANFTVLECANGEEALDMIESEVPNLIISEVMVPGIDGLAIREKISGSYKLKNIPYILLSHAKDEELINRALALDIEHYFKKPFLLSEVIGIIKNVVRKSTTYNDA